MKDNKIYTVIFTVLLGCICALVLTYANIQWRKLLDKKQKIKERILSIKRLS